MNRQIEPLWVQAMWIQGIIGALIAIGMIAYFVASLLEAGSEVFKEIREVLK